MDENGHIELHLTLDDLWEEWHRPDDHSVHVLIISQAELSVLAASLSLLHHLANDGLIGLDLDETGELGDPREAERLRILGYFAEHVRALYTNLILGEPLEA